MPDAKQPLAFGTAKGFLLCSGAQKAGRQMENWDEIRTALHVAKCGTVSGAAQIMGVHHATVIRHIDALEQRLGAKLFQRHARGYTPTEAGRDLLAVAQTTHDQFAQLTSRIKGQGVEISGELVITSLIELSQFLTPALSDFQAAHPNVTVRFLTGGRIFRLEYGEAHLAIRAVRPGTRPEQPDNVVQPFTRISMQLVGSKDYFSRYGMPKSDADLPKHRFVALDPTTARAPFNQWLGEIAPPDRVMFRVEETAAMRDAILAGAGMGFMPRYLVAQNENLQEATPARPHWATDFLLITHVDLHRTPKVQAALSFLKSKVKEWDLS
jgi:DNA-binding transcriptional LysR family regulator